MLGPSETVCASRIPARLDPTRSLLERFIDGLIFGTTWLLKTAVGAGACLVLHSVILLVGAVIGISGIAGSIQPIANWYQIARYGQSTLPSGWIYVFVKTPESLAAAQSAKGWVGIDRMLRWFCDSNAMWICAVGVSLYIVGFGCLFGVLWVKDQRQLPAPVGSGKQGTDTRKRAQ